MMISVLPQQWGHKSQWTWPDDDDDIRCYLKSRYLSIAGTDCENISNGTLQVAETITNNNYEVSFIGEHKIGSLNILEKFFSVKDFCYTYGTLF
jgi:hypothetical protein